MIALGLYVIAVVLWLGFTYVGEQIQELIKVIKYKQ